MDNLKLYNIVREVPKEAKKEIKGGRMSGKTDINPMWRIKALTEQFGPCGIGWYYKTINKWLETYGEEVAAFVDIELYIKYDNEWSMPIQGTGGSMFVAKEKNGPFVSDECYKMATTDAISVACKQLGIGADVYFEADRTKYDNTYLLESEILQSIYDLIEVYIQMVDGVTKDQVLNVLQNKYGYVDITKLSKENASIIIEQLEVWIKKQTEKNESIA